MDSLPSVIIRESSHLRTNENLLPAEKLPRSYGLKENAVSVQVICPYNRFDLPIGCEEKGETRVLAILPYFLLTNTGEFADSFKSGWQICLFFDLKVLNSLLETCCFIDIQNELIHVFPKKYQITIFSVIPTNR